MTPPIRMVPVPIALPLKLIDTLKPLAIVAEKLKHCHVVEVCEPTADNPSRTTIPMPREWFERTADDLEAIAILMHGAGVLSEGQAATLTGLDRVEVRKQVDALTAAPVREEGGGWSAVRNVFVTYAGRFSQAARYEEASAIADMAAHDLAALATREEALAEAGEIDLYDDKVQAGIAWTMRQWGETLGLKTWDMGDGSESVEGDVGAEIHTILVDAGLRDPETNEMAALRAQPQAREDAQPVAWLVGKGGGAILTRAAAWAAGKRDQGVSVTPLYTHPAPDALRVAVEALEKIKAVRVCKESANIWTGADACRKIATEALAALQAEQKGGA